MDYKTTQKPIILREKRHTLKNLETLKARNDIWRIHDVYEHQLRELFDIKYPQLIGSRTYKTDFLKFFHKRSNLKKKGAFPGNWIYFPWSGMLLHTVSEEEYNVIRTNRNRNLITNEEQKKLFSGTIGIVGLSVGNAIALSLAHSGIGNAMQLAEHDTLDTSNLNRIRAGIGQVGLPKIEITARQIYEINPYAKLTLYTRGINKKTLPKYIKKGSGLKVIFEVIDDFEMKIRLRLEARKARVPVVMLTSLGDNIMIDIERYDLDGKLPLFNGLAGNAPEKILRKPITEEDKQKYAVQIVGVQNIPTRALESVKQVRKTLVARPQLASSIAIAGGIAAYIARKIILNEPAPSGRSIIKLTDVI